MALLVGIGVGIGIGLHIAKPPPEKMEIPIGVLVDLSGPLATYGKDILDTAKIAAEDVNEYFDKKGIPFFVKLYPEDTRVDPKIALEKVMALHGKGVGLMVGPMGSGEVKGMLGYITANKLIIISPSSTAAPELLGVVKPEDKKYAFRFVPIDAFQTKAIAKEASELGIKAVSIAHIGNAWGRGLRTFGVPEFEKIGIKVAEPVEYTDPPPADFSPYIATIESQLKEFRKVYAWKEIAVVVFSYEEAFTMLAQVPEGSPMLEVIWIGCDGTALSGKALEVVDRAEKVKVYSTLFESKGKAFKELENKMIERYGKSPYQYGMNAYDATWVLALSYNEVYKKLGKYDADEMAKMIPVVTKDYSEGKYGIDTVSGYIELDEWNDRASGDYAIHAVIEGRWKKVGLWDYVTGEIKWY